MTTEYQSWYCGYVELKVTDFTNFGNFVSADTLSINPLFKDFYGEVTFFGKLPYEDNYYAGFDTGHPFMENVTPDDCMYALKKTVDRLEKLQN